jgi:hypothetical protein
MQTNREKEISESNALKSELEELKLKVNALEMKALEYQHQLAQERLRHANSLRRNSGGALHRSKRHHDNEYEYYSECQLSRMLEQQDPKSSHNKTLKPSPFTLPLPTLQEFNMGELFMGRKGKLKVPTEPNHTETWSKMELLNNNNDKNNNISSHKNLPKSKQSRVDTGQITYESALEFLRKENENLKLALF